ncbi:hypothetical protein H175_328p014 (plasmid) [Bacillus thuringiensis serovar thuringiensis str. IS5056]|nr:hypothetical protein H175_328p014 [Bacillus thuringiensis serovar thuringiensis str. IS5056]
MFILQKKILYNKKQLKIERIIPYIRGNICRIRKEKSDG